MILEIEERLVLRCDKCPVRLDLGRASTVRARNRTPSGWIKAGPDSHYCPRCSPTISMAVLFRQAAGVRAQPLL